MNPIELQEVRKIYPGGGGIHACTLSFRDGGATALLGPSGSGKTTLLQLINGLARPDSGGLRVLGKPIDYDALPRLRLSMGYAVQGTGLFPHLTAFENVALLARVSGWEEECIRSRIAELGRFVGLEEDLWQRYPHELSGGQQQRFGLCRAMVLNPPILLLDEPFGALDPITKAEIHREFLKLRRSEPRTVLLVTHDVREAMRLADHIILLKEGRVIQEGSKEDFLSRPADAWVAEFFALQLEE